MSRKLYEELRLNVILLFNHMGALFYPATALDLHKAHFMNRCLLQTDRVLEVLSGSLGKCQSFLPCEIGDCLLERCIYVCS